MARVPFPLFSDDGCREPAFWSGIPSTFPAADADPIPTCGVLIDLKYHCVMERRSQLWRRLALQMETTTVCA